MKYAWAFLIVLTCLIPFMVGVGFGWDALLKYCTSNNGCDDDEICSNNQCVYACKNKGCSDGALCVATRHAFACECPSGFQLTGNDTAGVCRRSCNQNTDCASTESCELGVCINACAMYLCNQKHATTLAYNHKCTCECLPKFRPNLKDECTRIPVCNVNQDCHYSEKCSDGRCVGICLDVTCFPNQGCIAYNHTYICGNLTQVTTVYKSDAANYVRSVYAPLAQEILLNILAYSTLSITKLALSQVLFRKPEDFNWPATETDQNFQRVKQLIEDFSIHDLDEHSLHLGAIGEQTIWSVAKQLKMGIVNDTEHKREKFRLSQVIDFIIVPKNLQTTCVTTDAGAATVTFRGVFKTKDIIETNFKSVAIPYKGKDLRILGVKVVFLYSKIPRHKFTSTEVQELFELEPKIFFSEEYDLDMGITLPKNFTVMTQIDVGKTFLQPDLNIQKMKFRNSAGSITYGPNEYAIYQNISIEMGSFSFGVCSETANEVLLDQSDFAMFIVSEELIFFRVLYPSSR